MKQKACTVIIKVNNLDFVKYRGVTNFRGLYTYLDNNFKAWRYGNVFFEGVQIGNFTNKNRPFFFN